MNRLWGIDCRAPRKVAADCVEPKTNNLPPVPPFPPSKLPELTFVTNAPKSRRSGYRLRPGFDLADACGWRTMVHVAVTEFGNRTALFFGTYLSTSRRSCLYPRCRGHQPAAQKCAEGCARVVDSMRFARLSLVRRSRHAGGDSLLLFPCPGFMRGGSSIPPHLESSILRYRLMNSVQHLEALRPTSQFLLME